VFDLLQGRFFRKARRGYYAMLVVNGLLDMSSLKSVLLLEMSRATDTQESFVAMVELALSSLRVGHLIASTISALKAWGPRWLSATSSFTMLLMGRSRRLKEGCRDLLMVRLVTCASRASSLIPLQEKGSLP
jgi:hypothetical protein